MQPLDPSFCKTDAGRLIPSTNDDGGARRYRDAMLTWFVRVAIVRFLGRRVVPLLIVIDLFRMLLAARRVWMRPKANR
jgi:hypothetical protein